MIYRYDACIILVQESCVSWESRDQCGTSPGACRQTGIVGLIPTVQEGSVAAQGDHDRFEMVLLSLLNTNTKYEINLSWDKVNV